MGEIQHKTKNLSHCHLVRHRILHELGWYWTWTSVMTGWQIPSHTMAQPESTIFDVEVLW